MRFEFDKRLINNLKNKDKEIMDGYGKGGAQSNTMFSSTGRAVMQKKFQINDGTNKFQEMNTLLEPANVATADQNVKEEINEVSVQLSQIKKKHDEAKK